MLRSASDPPPGGFTLIELLAAMALLAVLVVGATGIINSVANNTSTSNDSTGAATRARLVLDRMDHDLLARIVRPDAPAVTGIAGKADAPAGSAPTIFSLLAEVPGAPPASETGREPAASAPSVIHYRLVSDAPVTDGGGTLPAVQRAAMAVSASDYAPFAGMNNVIGLDDKGASATPPEPSAEDYVTIAPGVLAVAIGSLRSDGGFELPAGGDLSKARVAVVAVAVVDDSALTRASPEQLRALAGTIPAPVAGATLPLEQWAQHWKSGPPGGLPEFLWKSLRFYQRLVPLS